MTILEQVAAFDHQVTGISVSPEGRIFVNFPRWTDDAPMFVAELQPDGSLCSYPDQAWNSWRNAKAMVMDSISSASSPSSQIGMARCGCSIPPRQGMRRYWKGDPKLVRIDLATDRVTNIIVFAADVALQGTYLNNIRFSPGDRVAYITDSGTRGAIIVVDLESGAAFRALDGHASTQIEKDVVVEVDGAPLRRPDGRQPAFSSDGIALFQDGKTLYWQALTGRMLYAIDTGALAPGTPAEDIEAAVVKMGTTHVADGLWMSREDMLYLTSPADNAVKRWTGKVSQIVVQDARLRWPDTLSEGPDGSIYVTASPIRTPTGSNRRHPRLYLPRCSSFTRPISLLRRPYMNGIAIRPLAVITGGSSGIGLELARQFAENGYALLLVAESEEHLAQARASLAAGGASVETHASDLSTEQGVDSLYAARRSRPVDILCVNAGIGLGGPFVETDLQRELKMIDLNARGAVQLTKMVLKDMVARDSGKLLFTSSIAATQPDPFEAVYGSTKIFLRWFGEALRNELKDTGVGVTVLMPSVTDTNFFARADMLDTRAGTMENKDDPAVVAKAAYDALMADKHKVVPTIKNKIMGALSDAAPAPVAAQVHRALSEPGSGEKG